MSSNDITTNELCKKFQAVLDDFVNLINNSKLADEYIHVLCKITYTLRDAAILWSRAAFKSTDILMRSIFEAVVLLEYLIYVPDALKEYKHDSELAQFKLFIAYLERGIGWLDQLIKIYENLDEKTKKNIKLRITNNKVSYNENFLIKFTPIFQRTHKMLKKIEENNAPNIAQLNNFRPLLYDNNCFKSHTELNASKTYHDELTDKEIYIGIKDGITNSLLMLEIIIKSIKNYTKLEDCFIDKYRQSSKEILNYINFEKYMSSNLERVL